MMTHNYKPGDVENALQRYRDLTGDHAARLESTPGKSAVRYRVTGSKYLRGFQVYGAFGAVLGIEQFCNGFEAGRDTAPK